VHEEVEEKEKESKDVEAEEILSLVSKIDQANAELYRLQDLSRNKD
jgi:hypothetical protein